MQGLAAGVGSLWRVFALDPPTANISRRPSLVWLQKQFNYQVTLKEIWGATCFTWGGPSLSSTKQINKAAMHTHPAKRAPSLVVQDFPPRDAETTRINWKAPKLQSKALAMPFIHHEWSSTPRREKPVAFGHKDCELWLLIQRLSSLHVRYHFDLKELASLKKKRENRRKGASLLGETHRGI